MRLMKYQSLNKMIKSFKNNLYNKFIFYVNLISISLLDLFLIMLLRKKLLLCKHFLEVFILKMRRIKIQLGMGNFKWFIKNILSKKDPKFKLFTQSFVCAICWMYLMHKIWHRSSCFALKIKFHYDQFLIRMKH